MRSLDMSLSDAFSAVFEWERRRMHSQAAVEGPRTFAEKREPRRRGADASERCGAWKYASGVDMQSSGREREVRSGRELVLVGEYAEDGLSADPSVREVNQRWWPCFSLHWGQLPQHPTRRGLVPVDQVGRHGPAHMPAWYLRPPRSRRQVVAGKQLGSRGISIEGTLSTGPTETCRLKH